MSERRKMSEVSKESVFPQFKPVLYRLSNSSDRKNYTALTSSVPHLLQVDLFEEQFKELIVSRNPLGKPTKEVLDNQFKALIENKSFDELGVWVYYPWRNQILHILDEEEFVELRTSRNLYKITPEEEDLLRTKSVGIIGLSVGHAVATNLALERSVGELRLADFDTLELSNLNRIKTNLLNIGLPKVVIAAREISELDPFLKVECFFDGINSKNIGTFLDNGKKLDLLVEECDSLDVKILSRTKAREMGIPVIMETSDRGMIDVERYDLEPDRPILHGLIEHLDLNAVSNLKNSEEKIPFLMPMVGIDTASYRLKASALEVGSTINTWPQLASSVMLGGALLSDTYRRIMLDDFRDSGRYILDPSEILKGRNTKTSFNKNQKPEALDSAQMSSLFQRASIKHASNSDIDVRDIEIIVEASGTAPSGGNSQPWIWYVKNNVLCLFFDSSRSDSFMDYKHSASYISLGSCMENAQIQAHALGYPTQVDFHSNDTPLIAVLTLSARNEAFKKDEDLANQIFNRYTDRSVALSGEVESRHLLEIQAYAQGYKDLDLRLIIDEKHIQIMADVVSSGDRLRILNPSSHYDLVVEEMRWSKDHLNEENNGIFVEELKLSSSDMAGLQLIKDQRVTDFLSLQKGGYGLKRTSSRLVKSAPALFYLFTKEFDQKAFFEAGQVMERIWLYCTKHKLGLQIMNVQLAFLLRHKNGDLNGLSADICKEIELMADSMRGVFEDWDKQCDVLFFRIFHTNETASNSIRKDLNQILEIG